MPKILSIRIIAASLALALAACASGPEKRVNEGAGPVSARARNALAADNPLGLIAVGEGFERSGDVAGALKLYLQAQAAAPDMVEPQVAVARALVKLGRQDDGISRLKALLAGHPDDAAVRQTMVEALVLAGQYADAGTVLTPMLAEESAPVEFLDLAGRLAEVTGDRAAARSWFDKALKRTPGSPAVVRHLALSFALEGAYETAVALLQPGMDRADTLVETQESLALVYALSGQKDAAMHIARAVLPAEELGSLRLFYDLLPKLGPREQAEALMFDRIPADILRRMAPARPGRASK